MTPSRIAAAFRRRPQFNIIAGTVTVLIAVAALEVVDLWWRYDRALQTAETRAPNMAVVLAEYIRGSFASADAAIRQLQRHGGRLGGSSAPREDWEPMLAAAKAAPGLAIVRHLVELRGGTVTAESPGPDRGATFRVRLPVRPVTKPADSAHDDAAAPVHSSPVLRK